MNQARECAGIDRIERLWEGLRGEMLVKQSRFTPLLERASCGNRPVRRASHL